MHGHNGQAEDLLTAPLLTALYAVFYLLTEAIIYSSASLDKICCLEIKKSPFFEREEGREQFISEEDIWSFYLLQSCGQLQVLSSVGLLIL